MKPNNKILICAATKNEIANLKCKNTVETCITGVGYFSSIYNLTKRLLLHEYCFIFAVGIAGDYRLQEPIPQLYVVSKTRFADTGFEGYNQNFVPLVGSQFIEANKYPFTNGILENKYAQIFADNFKLKTCNANTVNCTHTSREYINDLLNRFPAEIETMESAALQYVAMQENIPFIEIRATSNHVTPKNTENWKTTEAINVLNNFINDNIIDNNINVKQLQQKLI